MACEPSTTRQTTPADPADSKSRWKVAGEVIAALGGLAAVAALPLMIWPPNDDAGTVPSSPSGALTTAPPSVEGPRTGDTSATPLFEVGDCFDASLSSESRCDVEHAFEVFALGDCSNASLISYLGGSPTVDIVRATPKGVDLASGSACVVAPPDGAASNSPAAGVLQEASDDAWRSCIDDRTDQQDVSCAALHTGEWVSTNPTTDDAVNCEELATRYLDAPPSRFTGRLQVGSSRGPAGPRCFVTVLGGDLLNGSLRNIGVSSLPTE
jgi:hypothetical protein